MSGFDPHQMAMDAASWILYWGSAHREFNVSLKWLAEFVKYLCGFTTQSEEDWLDEQANRYYLDFTGRPRDSNFLACSTSLTKEFLHSKKRWFFSERGSMNIADLFDEMGDSGPKQYGMSGADFAACLLCNPKQRFFIDISI